MDYIKAPTLVLNHRHPLASSTTTTSTTTTTTNTTATTATNYMDNNNNNMEKKKTAASTDDSSSFAWPEVSEYNSSALISAYGNADMVRVGTHDTEEVGKEEPFMKKANPQVISLIVLFVTIVSVFMRMMVATSTRGFILFLIFSTMEGSTQHGEKPSSQSVAMEGIDNGIELSMLRISKQDELHLQTPIEVTGEKPAGSMESNSALWGALAKLCVPFRRRLPLFEIFLIDSIALMALISCVWSFGSVFQMTSFYFVDTLTSCFANIIIMVVATRVKVTLVTRTERRMSVKGKITISIAALFMCLILTSDFALFAELSIKKFGAPGLVYFLQDGIYQRVQQHVHCTGNTSSAHTVVSLYGHGSSSLTNDELRMHFERNGSPHHFCVVDPLGFGFSGFHGEWMMYSEMKAAWDNLLGLKLSGVNGSIVVIYNEKSSFQALTLAQIIQKNRFLNMNVSGMVSVDGIFPESVKSEAKEKGRSHCRRDGPRQPPGTELTMARLLSAFSLQRMFWPQKTVVLHNSLPPKLRMIHSLETNSPFRLDAEILEEMSWMRSCGEAKAFMETINKVPFFVSFYRKGDELKKHSAEALSAIGERSETRAVGVDLDDSSTALARLIYKVLLEYEETEQG